MTKTNLPSPSISVPSVPSPTEPSPAVPVVIGADGGDRAQPPTPRQQQLIQAACGQIEADPQFRTLNGAVLSHTEVNAGLSETQKGYLYLRYDVPGATPQEFWAHVGPSAKLSWHSGQVSVPLGPAEAQDAAPPPVK